MHITGSYKDENITVMSMDDMCKRSSKAMSIQPSRTPKLSNDGIYGKITTDCFSETVTVPLSIQRYQTADIITATISRAFDEPELKPFKCENCGGNSYSVKDGVATCDYCGTRLVRR